MNKGRWSTSRWCPAGASADCSNRVTGCGPYARVRRRGAGRFARTDSLVSPLRPAGLRSLPGGRDEHGRTATRFTDATRGTAANHPGADHGARLRQVGALESAARVVPFRRFTTRSSSGAGSVRATHCSTCSASSVVPDHLLPSCAPFLRGSRDGFHVSEVVYPGDDEERHERGATPKVREPTRAA